MSLMIQQEELSLNIDPTSFKKKIGEIIEFAQSLIVDNAGAYDTITRIYRNVKDSKKMIEGLRKEAVAPAREHIAFINDKVKEITDPLTAIEDLAKFKVDGYVKLQEQRQKEQEEKLKKAALLFETEEVFVPKESSTIRGDGAYSYVKVQKKFRVADISKVPLEFLQVNEELVQQHIKLGMTAIPGIEVYEEKTTQIRSR